MQRDACISQDKLYRYTLTRIWNPRSGQRLMGFIMLNPSTADSNDDDPTIDLCMLTALKYDFDGIYVGQPVRVDFSGFRRTSGCP